MTIVTAPPAPSDPLTEGDLGRLGYGGGRCEVVDGVLYISREPGGFTPRDLDDLPDDGRYHELLDGVVVVSPAPGHPHQRMVAELYAALREAAPPELEALFAPTTSTSPRPRSANPTSLSSPACRPTSRPDVPCWSSR